MVLDHLVGLEIIERMGFATSAAVIRNRLPTEKRTRSADMGEILASDYVDQVTEFSIPIWKLRSSKDDRNLVLRGDDILAVKILDGRV